MKSQIKSIEIGRNVIDKIAVKDEKVQENKVVIAEKDTQGNVIFQDENYVLIEENDLWYGDSCFIIVRKKDVWEITEKVYAIEKEDVELDKIFPDILDLEIKDILKKCCENKIVVHFEYDKSYYEKYGIIEKVEDDRIIFKEIGKSTGVFIAKCEIMIDEISFLFVKNYRVKE